MDRLLRRSSRRSNKYYDEVPSELKELLPRQPHQQRLKKTITNQRISRLRGRPQDNLKIVSNGYYFRIKIPPKSKINTNINPKNTSGTRKGAGGTPGSISTSKGIIQQSTGPLPQNLPKNLSPPIIQQQAPPKSSFQFYADKILQWFRENFPVIALNFGSICILIGFSRSDVLELRSLTMTGQLTFAIYNLAQQSILWPSVAWSMTFASVNAVKIFNIFQERNAEVNLTKRQEEIYTKYFMPHGITPKQFERIDAKSETVKLKKGDYLIKKGDILDHVFLVVEGSTHAHLGKGQHLVAASTASKGDQLEGGDSGAWIGELTFLDRLWDYEQGLTTPGKRYPVPKPGMGLALYTIIADDDCTVVMTWTHSDMTDLMESSTDLKSALARAMTSAVVAKVVNLTVTHHTDSTSTWRRWLSDWRRSTDGSEVHIQDKLRATKEGSV